MDQRNDAQQPGATSKSLSRPLGVKSARRKRLRSEKQGATKGVMPRIANDISDPPNAPYAVFAIRVITP